MIQHKDIATVVRKADEFLFLEEIIPWTAPDPVAKRGKPKRGKGDGLQAAPTILDQFMFGAKSGGDKAIGEEEVEDLTQRDIVMNEDGTMYAAGGENQHDEFA
ncbi:hypothetical protein BDQ12DRAFT_463535 [Crucibulum laeve]|uniref:Transcription factor CBF/NF-Y/archaeal histone domain-containing protein n=1 Tax=Crucibulum laeve TaxID=68775 RepID=A0A5C3M5T7_9AGAR|nr:hypothetical protein BDQ12DRAFT_463535 [Crucibulum laeve]